MGSIDLSRQGFHSRQVCEVLGLTARRLNHWDRQGLVRPSLSPAAGRGSRRSYSYSDLLALQVVSHLREEGVSLQKIAKAVRYLRRGLPDVQQPLSFCVLMAAQDTVYLVRDEKTLVDTVRRQGQHAMVEICIDALDRDLRQRILHFWRPRVEEVTVGRESYQVQIEMDEDSGWFVAEVAGLPGCITQGQTLDDVLRNAREAIGLWLEAREDLARQGIRVTMDRAAQRKATA